MSDVTNRLAELREGKDWTQTFVAAERGVSEKTISRWETGVTPIPSEQIPALAHLLGVTPEHLMGWDRIGLDMNQLALDAAPPSTGQVP